MKRLLICITILFILPLLCMPASAHPGKTDADGGHYDQETGEYHYHHGYPAHDHYDMDGDGYVDCPYDFDDQTGRYSGSSSSSVGGTSYRQPISAKKETKPSATKPAITRTASSERSPGGPLLTICIPVIAILFLVARKRKKQLISLEEDAKRDIASFREKLSKSEEKQAAISKQFASSEENLKHTEEKLRYTEEQLKNSEKMRAIAENNCRKLLQSNNNQRGEFSESLVSKENEIKTLESTKKGLQDHCSTLQKENSALSEKLSIFSEKGDTFRKRLGIPMDVYFINRNIPIRGKIELYKPYGIFTVYVSDRGRCYHTNYFCSSAIVHPEHKYDVIQRLHPCKKCAMGTVEPVPSWYVELRKLDVDLVTRQTNEYYEQLEMQYQELLEEKDNSKSTR